MRIERLEAKDLVPVEVAYEDVFDLLALYNKIAFKSDVVLVGPKGIGKTLSIAAWAARNHSNKRFCPIVTVDCTEDVRRTSLLGSFYLGTQDSPFTLGPIPTAIEIANEVGRCILQFEELNALMPQMQKLLNPITDWRRKIELPEVQRVFRLERGAQLWVTGTMNTSVYGGVYGLNEDLKSRFRMPPLRYPTDGEERKIINTALSYKADKTLVSDMIRLATETRAKTFEYSLSPRDVVQVLEDVKLVGLDDALWMLLGKFEGEERETAQARISSIFRRKHKRELARS